MELAKFIAQSILDIVGKEPNGIAYRALQERACEESMEAITEVEFLDTLNVLQKQKKITGRHIDGEFVLQPFTEPEVPGEEWEYSIEFASMILATDARGRFEELDCDEHLAYLDNLIDQALAAKAASDYDQDTDHA